MEVCIVQYAYNDGCVSECIIHTYVCMDYRGHWIIEDIGL